MQTSIEKLTPKIAEKWLASNTSNRPVSRSWVDTLSGAMARGEWKCNGEPIIFSESGKMIDGQHRSHAVIKSGVTIPVLVVRGVADSAFDTLDQGKKRGVADVLALRGYKSTSQMSGAISAMHTIESGYKNWSAPTPVMAEKIVERHPAIAPWTQRYSASHARKFMPTAVIAIFCLGEENHGEEFSAIFLQELSDGVGLTTNSPTRRLRERFLEARSSPSRKLSKTAQMMFLVKGWNAFIQEKPLVQFRYQSDESIPAIK